MKQYKSGSLNIHKKFLTVLIISVVVLGMLTACKGTAQYDPNYDFAVIESALSKNKSIISYYDEDLKRVNQQEVPYGGLTDNFTPGVIIDGKFYMTPEGIDGGKGLTLTASLDLKSGEIQEYQHGKDYEGEKWFAVNGDRIFVNTNGNGDTYLGYYDIKTKATKDVIFQGKVMMSMIADDKHLYAFGDENKLQPKNGIFRGQLYIIDKETLEIVEQKDLGDFYDMTLSVIYKDCIYFSATDQGLDTPEEPVLFKYDIKSKKLTYKRFPKGIIDDSSIFIYKDKIYISNASLATGIGKTLTVYDPQSNKMKVKKFKHNLSQVEIKNGCLYALDYDAGKEEAKFYKYKIKGEDFKLIASTDVYTQKDNKDLYFYVGSFFLK